VQVARRVEPVLRAVPGVSNTQTSVFYVFLSCCAGPVIHCRAKTSPSSTASAVTAAAAAAGFPTQRTCSARLMLLPQLSSRKAISEGNRFIRDGDL
jgi:hypothetical protein